MRISKSQTTPSLPALVLLTFILCGVFLAGCRRSNPGFSGFLRDYSGLRASSEDKAIWVYKHPNLTLADYDKFIVDPILVHFAPNAKGTAIDPVKVMKLTDYAGEHLRDSLSKHYLLVGTPGPRVLRLRIAITEIKKTTPPLNILPPMKLSGVGLGGASMEAEAIDSQSGERVLAVMDSQMGNRLSIVPGLDPLGHAKQVIRKWVRRFVKRMDKAHGY